MEPLTAIGLASNILSFIDFGAKVIACAKEIHGSVAGVTDEALTSEAVATGMREFASKLQLSSSAHSADDKEPLCRLARECEGIANRIIDLLNKTKSKTPNSKSVRWTIVATFNATRYAGERQKLEERLAKCREQLAIHLN